MMADPVIRITYWKRDDPWTYYNWMPRSWVESVMAKERAIAWRVGR
jgi:hypothetical protein